MDNEIEIKTSNEIEETNGIYTVPNILLFDYSVLGCAVYIINQEKFGDDFGDLYIQHNDSNYTISSVNRLEINRYNFYFKGRVDFGKELPPYIIEVDIAHNWEEIFAELPDFAVIHSRKELDKYLKETEGGDKTEIDFSFSDEPTEEDIENMIKMVDLSTFCKIIQNRLRNEYEGHFCSEGYYRPKPEDIGTINNTWAKDYLVNWAKAKFKFYKIFGNKLSIEQEVEHIPTDYDAKNLKKALISNMPVYAPIIEGFSDRIIKENKMRKGEYPYQFEGIKDVDKMTFTKFMSLYNNPNLDNEISKLYQANRKTILTISINPIDYLTVSINKTGWKSCHNFFDGGWGTAGLSLMFDKTSLVGFSSVGMVDYTDRYRPFTWNNKMWREMIYVSEENSAMVFSRQYPFDDERFSSVLRQLMEQAYSRYFNANNKWLRTTRNDKYIKINSTGDLLYNDVKNGFDYIAIINKQDKNKKRVTCDIGSQLKHLSNKRRNVKNGGSTIW